MSSPIEITSALFISGAIVIGAFILPAKDPMQKVVEQKAESTNTNTVIFDTNNQINQKLEINTKTVEQKVNEIKKKLDLIEKKIEQRK